MQILDIFLRTCEILNEKKIKIDRINMVFLFMHFSFALSFDFEIKFE